MPTPTAFGYKTPSIGQPLERFGFVPPELSPNDVRVAVTHCGICHTDIQAIDDFYEITKYPFVPGHEIVGTISELGSAVTSHKLGDRVGIGWLGRSCGQCEWCLRGREEMCMDIVASGTWLPNGGFSSSVIANEGFAYQIPPGMPSEVAAVLMCAGVTVYSPLKRYANEPSMQIAITGCGGLGHLAIQFAHALNHKVTVFSSSMEKREQALAFGADDFVLTKDLTAWKPHYFKYDLLMVTSAGQPPWEYLLAIVKKECRIVLLGFTNMTMNPTDLVAHNISITGSFLGNRAVMREMLPFAQEHHIQPMIELMPMTEVNQALQRVKENKARYRIVLVN